MSEDVEGIGEGKSDEIFEKILAVGSKIDGLLAISWEEKQPTHTKQK